MAGTSPTRPNFFNSPPGQVAYVVRDLDRAVQSFIDDFGMRPWAGYQYDSTYVPRRTYLGQPTDMVTRNAIWDGGSIGLIQPVSGDSPFSRMLAERGPGVHHVSYFVDDIEEGRAWLLSRGKREIMNGGGHGVDGDGEYAYFEPLADGGCYLQLVQRPARRQAPHFWFGIEEAD